MNAKTRIALATATLTLGAGLAAAPGATASTATASAAGTQESVLACSTKKVNSKMASGWCSAGSAWRVGVKCTDGRHYYSAWERDARTQYATCGSGTITHYWIDR